MDDQTDEMNDQLRIYESNIDILKQKSSGLEEQKSQIQGLGAQNLTVDNIDSIVTTDDTFSEKIISISAKFNALEDCMGAVKKGFEKEAIDLPEYLKTIRALSMKQCK